MRSVQRGMEMMMNAIEAQGLQVMRNMGLVCFGDLGHIPLLQAFPDGSYSKDEHFEFDYFVVVGEVCFIGEITARSSEKDLRVKYKTFRRNVDLMRTANSYTQAFGPFNIPDDQRYIFNNIRSIQGFLITTALEYYDVVLSSTPNVSLIFRSDWQTIESYSDTLGRYAQTEFLKMIGWDTEQKLGKDLVFEAEDHKLMYLPSRFVVAYTDTRADIFTFVVSPKDLLEIAEVFRRELIPLVTRDANFRYQRPLDFRKLTMMRELVARPGFIFPNSILVALSNVCTYDPQTKRLCIPMVHGAISVIDGQHRLFSYASESLDDAVRVDARVMVTALRFQSLDKQIIMQLSAEAFIEINQNQKKISSAHIDEIAYTVLKREHPRALAAQVILVSNQKSSSLRGLFRSSQTTTGTFSAATVITQLAKITDMAIVNKLSEIDTSRRRQSTRKGYECLLELNFEQSISVQMLIKGTVVCLNRYFRHVQETFSHDWPENEAPNDQTTLKYTKVFSAFVRLLRQFLNEGKNWAEIATELATIKKNIVRLREEPSDYPGIIFEVDNEQIPDDRFSVESTFKFLDKMRRT